MTKTVKDPLSAIITDYIAVEQALSARINNIGTTVCASCGKTCCDEKYCRESIDSPFLKRLTRRQKVNYHPKNGWLGPQGCRLAYGRPPVCYEFFCQTFLADPVFIASGLQTLVAEFVNIGHRARGRAHLICVDDLRSISASKMFQINRRIGELREKLAAGGSG